MIRYLGALFVLTIAGASLAAGPPQRVRDIRPGPEGSYPRGLVHVDGTLLFAAEDGASGEELWRSFGRAADTVRLDDLDPGNSDTFPSELVTVNGMTFFVADDGASGQELWKSDGSVSGTVLVKDIQPGPGGSGPNQLVEMDGALYFAADDGVNGAELWRSDGTTAGTVLVEDIQPGSKGSHPSELLAVAGTLYFAADDGQKGEELWKSDGTASGTQRVQDIDPGANDSFPSQLVNLNGALLFVADDGTNGEELWRSDGTAGGTSLVKDIRPGPSGASPKHLLEMSGAVFFAAHDGEYGEELWRSDGTAAGTYMVADVNQTLTRDGLETRKSSFPREFANVGGTLYFSADDGLVGRELFKSDGSEAGTVRLKDIDPGLDDSYPEQIVDVQGPLFYFVADDGASGRELWKSDGTASGTLLVADLQPGAAGSSPEQLVDVNGSLFFVAEDDVAGGELWTVPKSSTRRRCGLGFELAFLLLPLLGLRRRRHRENRALAGRPGATPRSPCKSLSCFFALRRRAETRGVPMLRRMRSTSPTAMLGISVWALAAGWMPAPALAQPNTQGRLDITEVAVDFPAPGAITILGNNFPEAAKLKVSLADFGELAITSSTETQIVAALPAGVEAGDYLLSVYKDKMGPFCTTAGSRDCDEFDLTIGAVGPTGDQGEQGKLGPQGEQGKLGPQGEQGKLGLQGEQGKLGPAGADGADGAQGPQGKVGPPGEDAVISAQACPAGQFVNGIDSEGNLTCASLPQLDCPAFGGPRFLNRGLTVLDCETGLEWEKKTAENVDDRYTWSAELAGTAPNGTAFTEFIPSLDGFAGHPACASPPTDCTGEGRISTLSVTCESPRPTGCWRLPDADELATIMTTPGPGGGWVPDEGFRDLQPPASHLAHEWWTATTWTDNAQRALAIWVDPGGNPDLYPKLKYDDGSSWLEYLRQVIAVRLISP